jgi:hypothetical protein
MNDYKMRIGLLTSLLWVWIGSCQIIGAEPLSNRDSLSRITFPSLETILPILESEVANFEDEIALDSIAFQLSNEHPDERLLYAVYVSEDDPHPYYFVEYFSDGRVEIKERNFPAPNKHPYIIDSSEWKVDVNEAWQLFISNPEIRPIDESELECSSLMLFYKDLSEGYRLVWKLAIKPCEGEGIIQYHLDANTGEYLGVDGANN